MPKSMMFIGLRGYLMREEFSEEYIFFIDSQDELLTLKSEMSTSLLEGNCKEELKRM